jgi:pyridoxamine 5'-phosphate oxidase
MNVAEYRREYTLAGLSEADLSPDPIEQFQKWFKDAAQAQLLEPNAMVLATVNRAGQPSTRVVLLKCVDRTGFTFFTNYQSRKGHDLEENPNASLTFPWVALERQVTIIGRVTKVTREQSADYFKLRPRGSQLGAWVSTQSQVIPGREFLEARLRELEHKYPDNEVPLPPYWGGYSLSPDEIEFWQGRPNRLHDRLRYTREPNHSWKIERLSP